MFFVVFVCLELLLLLLCFENRGFIYVQVSGGNKTFARWAIGADPGSSPALIMPTPTCTSVCGGALRNAGKTALFYAILVGLQRESSCLV